MATWGRGGPSGRVRHWGTRALVVVGLAGLLVVGWSYRRYLTVWGDTPCERDPDLCDVAANVAAQRTLGWWYAAAAVLLAVGLVLTLVRRWLAPREGGRSGGAFGDRTRLALLAGARAAAVAVVVLAAFPLVLFGGTALLLAVVATALVVVAWLVDRLLRASGRADDPGGLLAGALAGVAAVLGSALLVTATVHWTPQGRPGGSSWGWLLAGFVVGAGVGAALVTAAVGALDRRGLRVAATWCWVVVLLAALTVAASPPGRESLVSLRGDLYPAAVAAAPPSRPAPEPEPQPTPAAPTPTPSPRPSAVPARRACTTADLALSARGWDSAMGTSAVTLVVTNRSGSACWVEGYPAVALAQSGHDLRVVIGHSTRNAYGTDSPVTRVGLRPNGGEAVAALSWKGYRAQADQTSPQVVSLTLRGATTPIRLPLDGATPRVDVVEGAAMELAPWQYPDAG